MAPTKKQAAYVKEMVSQIVTTGHHDTQQVLEDLLHQSLEDLQQRFKHYWGRLGRDGEDTQRMQTVISRSEKRISSRFYQDQKQDKKSKVRHMHREALKKCYSLLTNDLHLFKSRLMDDLIASDIVTLSDKDSIQKQMTPKRQNEEFHAYLVGRLTFDEFHNKFLPALSKDHQHLAEALISELDRLEDEFQDSQCVACRARKHIQLKRLAAPLFMEKVIEQPMFTDLRSPGLSNNSKWAELRQTVSDVHVIRAMEKKYPDFHNEFKQQKVTSLDCCCPTQDVAESEVIMSELESSTCYQTCDTDVEMEDADDLNNVAEFPFFQAVDLEQEYKMTAYPRGICLIISNTNFASVAKRMWSEHDVNKLTSTFERLQFSVVCKTDLTADQMVSTMKEYASRDHGQYDAFVCAIISHGNGNRILGSDEQFVKVQDLTTFFKASRCPTLADKPKIFILSNPRGVQVMGGHKKETGDVIADDADFLIGYSTTVGHKGFRNNKGSYYIDALTQVLDSQADKRDLLDCLTLTNQQVAKRIRRKNDEKQVPTLTFTLTKKVHFTSDPLWPHSAAKV